MTKEFLWILWNSSRVSSRILVASLSIQQFKWLSNSSKAKWPQIFYKILLGFWSEFYSLNQKIRWQWNSYEILKDFDQIYLQELDDNRILVKFFRDLIRIFQEIDDHGILMKFSKDFYQNFGDQCLSIQNSGIFMKFLKNFD